VAELPGDQLEWSAGARHGMMIVRAGRPVVQDGGLATAIPLLFFRSLPARWT
jgi:hypothetical protein